MKHLSSKSTRASCCDGGGRNGTSRGAGCCASGGCGCPPDCCPQVESIRARPLLDPRQRRKLASLFKVLDNDTRLHILHVLIKFGELSVNDLAQQLEMKPQAISNQLQKLSVQQIVESRRDGNLIFYRVVDPCVTMLLDLGLCLLEAKPGNTRTNRKSAGGSSATKPRTRKENKS